MKALRNPRRRLVCNDGLTLTEVLVVLAVFGMLVLWLIPALAKAKAKAQRISCISCLKNIGLAHRIFATDNQGYFTFNISSNGVVAPDRPPLTNSWGTRDWIHDPTNAWRHYRVLSNELSTPKIVWCPADRERRPAPNFASFTNNQFLSYTIGVGASEEQPQSVLASDRNLTLNGVRLELTVRTFATNEPIAFDQRIHGEAGNLLLGDGSVQQVTSGRLRDQFRDAVLAGSANTLVIP